MVGQRNMDRRGRQPGQHAFGPLDQNDLNEAIDEALGTS